MSKERDAFEGTGCRELDNQLLHNTISKKDNERHQDNENESRHAANDILYLLTKDQLALISSTRQSEGGQHTGD